MTESGACIGRHINLQHGGCIASWTIYITIQPDTTAQPFVGWSWISVVRPPNNGYFGTLRYIVIPIFNISIND